LLEGFGDLLFDSLLSLGQIKSSVLLVGSLSGLDDGLFFVSEGLGGLSSLLLFTSNWVLSDFFVNLGVELVDGINLGILEAFIPLGELSLVIFSISLDLFDVIGDVFTEDSSSVDLSIE